MLALMRGAGARAPHGEHIAAHNIWAHVVEVVVATAVAAVCHGGGEQVINSDGMCVQEYVYAFVFELVRSARSIRNYFLCFLFRFSSPLHFVFFVWTRACVYTTLLLYMRMCAMVDACVRHTYRMHEVEHIYYVYTPIL